MYLSIGTAEYEAAHGTPLKLLPFNGVPATTASVREGAFPLGRPLIFITAENPKPLIQAFVDYALSPDVQDLIEGQSFVAPR